MPSLSSVEISTRFYAVQGMARTLGETALSYFGNADALKISMKGAQDWLTEADGAIERQFRAMIAETFPGDAVIGEEQGGENAACLWIIDPIDGTSNFARGDRQWCISIGLVVDGVPELGLLYSAALDEMFLGRRGGGATLNGKPIRAAGTDDIRRSTIEVGWSKRRPNQEYFDVVMSLFGQGAAVKRSASGALGVAHVACGRTDGYIEAHINSWDVIAAVVIAQEAGAVTNNFCSGDWVRKGNPILAAAPGLVATLAKTSQIPVV